MTTVDDLVGQVYGNSINGSDNGEPQINADTGNGKDKKKKRKDNKNLEVQSIQKTKRNQIAYKYSNKGKGILHEAAIIAGLPVFLEYDNRQFRTVEHIEEASRIIKPPSPEEYPYEPYEFANIEEVREYAERAKSMSIDSLYTQVKHFVADYNDQDAFKLALLSLDIIFSHFQDKFATTHYDSIVGDNDSGKSSLGITFEALGYRPVYMTDPSAANIFRCLGTIEPGQCTIILDEADKIDKSPEMMAILKTGYQLNGKVPKINTNTLRQEFFWTYGFKIIIAEKSMSLIEAKGVYDRTFSFTAYPGDSAFDIKETLNPQGETECQKRLNELLSFRKLLLIYRLLHFKDAVSNIDTGLKRRNRELVKPLLQLFCNTELKTQKEIASILEGFLKAKQTRKENTIEAALCPLVTNLVSQHGREIPAKDIWNAIVENDLISGYYDEKRPNEFQSADYGTIYRNSITNVICDKLGAQKKHKETGSVLIFDIDKLVKICKSYNFDTHVQLKLLEDKYADSSDGSDGSKGKEGHSEVKDDLRTSSSPLDSYEKSHNISTNTVNHSIKKDSELRPSCQEPSELSELSVSSPITTTTTDHMISKSIYRLGHSDNWGCNNCKQKGDKWFMQRHVCRGLGK